MKGVWLPATALLLFELHLVMACFVTNCPPGGKRSGTGTEIQSRQCQKCGGSSGINGLCYGSQICCSMEGGCFTGTTETLECMKENMFHNTPCHNPGEPCSGNDSNINGQCAAPGICCSTETCTPDESCVVKELLDTTPKAHGRHKVQREQPLSTFQRSMINRRFPRRFPLRRKQLKSQTFPQPRNQVGIDSIEDKEDMWILSEKLIGDEDSDPGSGQ